MKTIEIKNMEQALKLAGEHQLSAQELLNERIYIDGKGWSNVKLGPAFKVSLVNQILDLLGGWAKHRAIMERVLMFDKPQHWGLARIFINDYGKGPYMSYCAGQDYPYELKQIRNYLKK